MKCAQDVVRMEETSISLPKMFDEGQHVSTRTNRELTYWNTEQAYEDSNTCDSQKGIRDTFLKDPWQALKSKAEAEDILEDHHAGKSLDCRVRDKQGSDRTCELIRFDGIRANKIKSNYLFQRFEFDRIF